MLGKGGFGAVYQVKCTLNNQMYAAKCESFTHPKKVLSMDCKVLRAVQIINSPHFCRIFDIGKIEGKFRFIIITMLGASLHDLRAARPYGRFSLGTSLRMAQQCLEALQDMHTVGFIHRDIKPSNFGVGRRETNDFHIVYIIDFGLSRRFADAKKDIRAPRKVAPFRGTPRYASLRGHRKQEQSPCDDIESWFYVIVEWTAGQLPWRAFKNNEKDQILLLKEDARKPEGLTTLLRNCPEKEFTILLKYIDSLSYTSIPDYGYLYYILKHTAAVYKISPDQPLDFDPKHPYSGTEVPPDCLPPGVIVHELKPTTATTGKEKRSKESRKTKKSASTPNKTKKRKKTK